MSVLITGANRGMGLGYVKHYLAENWNVIATCRDLNRVNGLQDLKHEYGTRLKCLELDVTDQSSIESLQHTLENTQADFSLVINNAGISKEEKLEKWTIKNFENHFLVNSIGPAMVSRAVVSFMREGSKIVQISSGMGSLEWNINPENGLDAYAASKSALHSLTIRLSEKLKGKNIGVYLINPGWVKTEMGGNKATSSIDEAVANISTTIQKLTLEQTGSFLSEKGISIPW